MWPFDQIGQWRTNSRIQRLEQSLAVKATPSLYLQLANAHTESGNQTKAAQVLKLGAARYPENPEVVRRQAEAEKFEREVEKKRLVERIQTHPNPILYARLAELYKADDEISKTIDTCQRGIKAFPKYGGTYLVLGQIFSDKKQWPDALTQLERSVALDKYNYLALKLLSSVYMQLNRPADAAQRLEDILYFAPGDEAILDLLKKAREAAEALAPKSAAGTAATGAQSKSGSGKTKTSASRSGAGMARVSGIIPKPSSPKDQVYAKGLATMRGVAGVSGAILVDQYGLVIAADLDPMLDEGLAGALITNVYRLAASNSVKLGVGQFEEGIVEGQDGNMHLLLFDDMILTVFASPDVKIGMLEKSIRDFATSALGVKG
jgi:predicted regulator of Ras-like GTPase activity (Roadblock/LC7/MglB family)